MTDSILQEIKDDLRQEQLRHFWMRYGMYLIIAAVLIVVATGVMVGWKSYNTNRQESQGAEYFKALRIYEEKGLKDALSLLESIQKEYPGSTYDIFARLKQAEGLIAEEKFTDAVALLRKDTGAPKEWRDLGLLLAGYIELEHNLGTEKDTADLLDKVTDTNSPWHFSGMELQGLYALKNNKPEEALALFKALETEPSAPPSLRARAQELVEAVYIRNPTLKPSLETPAATHDKQ